MSAPGSKARLRLWLRMLRASRQVEAQLRDRLRTEFDTTLPRFDVLAALHRHPDGLKMSELSAFLIVSNGNVTGIIDRLVQDGLVERRAVPGDRRASRVQLTDQGRSSFARMADVHEDWIEGMLSGVSAEDALRIAAQLSAITTENDQRGTR